MKSTYEAAEVATPALAKLAIEAHGGLDRWERFTTLSVHGMNGGVLWGAKSKAGLLDDVTVIVDLRTRRLRTGPSAPRIEGLASNLNGSRATGGPKQFCSIFGGESLLTQKRRSLRNDSQRESI